MPFIPNQYQVQVVAERAIKQYPEHKAYIERAAQLVTDGHIEWLGDKWACFSQAHPNSYYTVNDHCGCPSFNGRGVPIMRGRKYCKHRLALTIYKDILLSQLNNRLVGNASFKHEVATAQANERAFLLYNDRNGSVCAFKERRDRVPSTVCLVRHSTERMLFRNNQEMATFAEWLHKALPLPPHLEMAEEDFINPEDYYAYLISQGTKPDDAAMLVDHSIGVPPDDIQDSGDYDSDGSWIPQL